jgi:hypothetical protein
MQLVFATKEKWPADSTQSVLKSYTKALPSLPLPSLPLPSLPLPLPSLPLPSLPLRSLRVLVCCQWELNRFLETIGYGSHILRWT